MPDETIETEEKFDLRSIQLEREAKSDVNFLDQIVQIGKLVQLNNAAKDGLAATGAILAVKETQTQED